MALSEPMFAEKMEKLNSTQQSIENTSSWCSLWRKDARSIAGWWETYFTKATQAKRLCMIYLASDVIQTSRKKGPEFVQEFFKVLPRALRHFLSKADYKSRASVNKVMKVWEERRVFGSSGTKTLQELMEEANVPHTSKAKSSKSSAKPSPAAVPSVGPQIPSTLVAAASLIAAADAAAASSAELAGAAESIDIQAAAASDQATTARETLQQYIAALQHELAQQDAARAALLTAAETYGYGASRAMQTLQTYEAKLAAFDQAQASAPTALVPEPAAGPGGVEATVDAAEAAALATQLMQNPQALIDAIAATMPLTGGGGPGGAAEYDPENMW